MVTTIQQRRQFDYLGDYPVRGLVRNWKYWYAAILHKDIKRLRELGCSRTMAIVAGALLNFYRAVEHKYHRLFRATQQWLSVNVLWEGLYDRTMVSRALTLLKEYGLLYCRKVAGYHTNEYIHGFIGWPEERSGQKEQGPIHGDKVPYADDLLQDDEEFREAINGSNPGLVTNVLSSRTSVRSAHASVPSTLPSYIYNNFSTPSQKPGGGEFCVTFENGKGNQEGGCQQFFFIENGSTASDSTSIEHVNEEFSRKQKAVGSGKNSGGRASEPVSGGRLNQLTPEQRQKFADRQFLLNVVASWKRREYSCISKLDCPAEQKSMVKGYLLKNPDMIDIEWEAYIEGRISTVCGHVINGVQGIKEIERYLPSIAIEMQSEAPVATEPILQLMEQLMEQHKLLAGRQPQSLLADVVEMAASLDGLHGSSAISEPGNAAAIGEVLEGQVVSESKQEEAELNEESSQLPAISFLSGVVTPAEESVEDSGYGPPPVSALQRMYKIAAMQEWVGRQIAANPEWGYAIVDGEVVEVQSDPEQEVDWDAIVEKSERDAVGVENEVALDSEVTIAPNAPPVKLGESSAETASVANCDGAIDWEAIGEGDPAAYEIVIVNDDGELEQGEEDWEVIEAVENDTTAAAPSDVDWALGEKVAATEPEAIAAPSNVLDQSIEQIIAEQIESGKPKSAAIEQESVAAESEEDILSKVVAEVREATATNSIEAIVAGDDGEELEPKSERDL